MYSPLVSIIIPVYNAEKTLQYAFESIMKQTYRYMEIILINDCSTDGSDTVLTRYMEILESLQISVKYMIHAQNQGVSTARNTGLNNATGDYIYFVDADDTLDADAIELLVREAVRFDADIVGCNWYLSFTKNERRMNQPSFNTAWDAIEKILRGTMRWNLWLFMVKRSLYEKNQIRFIDSKNMGEDLLMTIRLFSCAGVVCYVNRALYHYSQSNAESLTRVSSTDHIPDVTTHVEEVEACLYASVYKDIPDLENLLRHLKLHIKLPLLISRRKSDYNLWRGWFSEVNAYATANPSLSWRIRLLQSAAVKGHYWFLRMHYYLITRLVYGVLYR
ncbi:glycosyltransferase family 2 protein [Sphingobacterium spiritivorum]|uniref:glycosyltransferase family 2 protein n=1 Tax=Sphingobacterium spiritivorum TaxID=258 RepID=UPI001F1D4339|nr:glycosyltransferase [Sphingobacterium spiritivorum]